MYLVQAQHVREIKPLQQDEMLWQILPCQEAATQEQCSLLAKQTQDLEFAYATVPQVVPGTKWKHRVSTIRLMGVAALAH